jgi:hypothetical protein
VLEPFKYGGCRRAGFVVFTLAILVEL